MRTAKFPRLKAISVFNRTLASRRAFAPLATVPIVSFPADLVPLALPSIFDPLDLEPRPRVSFATVKPFIFTLLLRVPAQMSSCGDLYVKIRRKRSRYNNFSQHEFPKFVYARG